MLHCVDTACGAVMTLGIIVYFYITSRLSVEISILSFTDMLLFTYFNVLTLILPNATYDDLEKPCTSVVCDICFNCPIHQCQSRQMMKSTSSLFEYGSQQLSVSEWSFDYSYVIMQTKTHWLIHK